MRLFLDVGASDGRCTRQVIANGFAFDRFFCFEPQPVWWKALAIITDPRVVVCPFGLWNVTGPRPMWVGRRSVGASVYPDKRQPGRVRVLDDCAFVAAHEWFRDHLHETDHVVMKMNCEGAECDILEDLLDSGEYAILAGLIVAFDVRKVPSQALREHVIRRRLPSTPPVFVLDERLCYQRTRTMGADAFLRYVMAQIGEQAAGA